MRLEEALDALPPKRWYERFGERMLNNFARLQAAPVAAACCWWRGMGAGSLGGYEYAQARAAHAAAGNGAAQALAAAGGAGCSGGDQADVANISSIVRQPNSEMVEVRYNEVVPRQVEGSLDDPAIRQLLMMASEDATRQAFATIRWDCWRLSAARATAATQRAFATR